MDHLFRLQRSMHVQLTLILGNGGQIQPLESVIMILVKNQATLSGRKEIMSYFPSLPASFQKNLLPQSVKATLQIMLQMPACLSMLTDIYSDANARPMGIRISLSSSVIST